MTTHAFLVAMNFGFDDSMDNKDNLAFHEGFCDYDMRITLVAKDLGDVR